MDTAEGFIIPSDLLADVVLLKLVRKGRLHTFTTHQLVKQLIVDHRDSGEYKKRVEQGDDITHFRQ